MKVAAIVFLISTGLAAGAKSQVTVSAFVVGEAGLVLVGGSTGGVATGTPLAGPVTASQSVSVASVDGSANEQFVVAPDGFAILQVFRGIRPGTAIKSSGGGPPAAASVPQVVVGTLTSPAPRHGVLAVRADASVSAPHSGSATWTAEVHLLGGVIAIALGKPPTEVLIPLTLDANGVTWAMTTTTSSLTTGPSAYQLITRMSVSFEERRCFSQALQPACMGGATHGVDAIGLTPGGGEVLALRSIFGGGTKFAVVAPAPTTIVFPAPPCTVLDAILVAVPAPARSPFTAEVQLTVPPSFQGSFYTQILALDLAAETIRPTNIVHVDCTH